MAKLRVLPIEGTYDFSGLAMELPPPRRQPAWMAPSSQLQHMAGEWIKNEPSCANKICLGRKRDLKNRDRNEGKKVGRKEGRKKF